MPALHCHVWIFRTISGSQMGSQLLQNVQMIKQTDVLLWKIWRKSGSVSYFFSCTKTQDYLFKGLIKRSWMVRRPGLKTVLSASFRKYTDSYAIQTWGSFINDVQFFWVIFDPPPPLNPIFTFYNPKILDPSSPP